MSARALQYDAVVLRRVPISPHVVRLVLGGPGLAGFVSTGLPDEWVGLVVPGQFQSRYYTVCSWDGAELVLDVVIHAHGLVTEWAAQDCTGAAVTILEPKGSFEPPPEAEWAVLVGDLTAMPAMARIARETTLPTTIWAETPDAMPGYLAQSATITWTSPPGPDASALAEVVESIAWPEGPGYFWMSGESGQMRAIRKHVMRELRLPPTSYAVMGYWRAGATRQPRAVDVS